jgi:quercetin dioxygenase-like cupin family protein
MKKLSVLLLLLAVPLVASAAPKSLPGIVKGENKGPTRTYLFPLDEVYDVAVRAAEELPLNVERASDKSLFTGKVGPGRQLGFLSGGRQYAFKLRILSPRETELTIEEKKVVFGELGGGVIDRLHDRIGAMLELKRNQAPPPPRHALEGEGEATIIKRAALSGQPATGNLENSRVLALGQPTAQGGSASSLWEINGSVPLHFTPNSERRVFVLEGSLRMLVGTQEHALEPGDFLIIPRAVRTRVDLAGKSKRAELIVFETPAVETSKTVWLTPSVATQTKP